MLQQLTLYLPSMLIAILSAFVAALLFGFSGKGIHRFSKLSFLLPTALFAFFSAQISTIQIQGAILDSYSWVPTLGVNLGFKLDGLALLFVLMISGVGALVFAYTSNYLKNHAHLNRFYAYLSLFMGAMLGLVLSDNLVSLFVFWELTSISSFFLIGFNTTESESRKSAITALSVTGFGGLLLFAGLVLIAHVGGSLSIDELLHSSEVLKSSSVYAFILLFVFAGAFSKSAQFPLHFWLPGAMKAPTPVSTYLHSATMVKAGIYLLLRFTPILGDHYLWNNTLLAFGAVTMLYAAFQTLFKTDLKGILAYSTISALGILVFLIGLGSEEALIAALVFICVHALYKATLFLVTGIIDHETHTRDITQLSGLRKVLMPVAIIGFLAAASNAGIPPTIGFLGKDLIYETALNMGPMAMMLVAAAVLTNILLLYAGFLVGVKPFLGALPEKFAKVHMPSVWLWFPPGLLAVLGLVLGVFPQIIEGSIIQPAARAVVNQAVELHLKLWHGFNTVLLLSLITLAVGTLIYLVLKPSVGREQWADSLEKISPKGLILSLVSLFERFSQLFTAFFQSGYLRYYIIIILLVLISLTGYSLLSGVHLYIDFSKVSDLTVYEVSVLAIMFISILFTVFTQSRLAAVASMGVVGYAMCLLFVFYSAPDLAMTQFSIDTLTVILFVLVLYKLPKYLSFSNTPVRLRDGALALAFGSLITLLILEVLNENVNRETSNYYAENAYLLAKGKNVVNVILVDFRGFDTMVEISVLAIAAIGVFGLLKLRLKKEEKA